MKLKYVKENKKPKLMSYEPFFITTYISPSNQYVIRLLDDDFIRSLHRAGLEKWAKYMSKRKRILEQTCNCIN